MKKTTVVALVLSLATPVAMLQPQRAGASHQFMWFSDSGDPMATFGGNQGVVIDGAIEFIRGCATGGIDDVFYPIADVYVRAAAHAGGGLVDVSGTPNTIFGVGGGTFVSELIAYTGPDGELGSGTYDIVFDECQDGVLGPEDAVFDRAITVEVPANVPPLPSGSIRLAKAAATDMASHWEKVHDAYEVLFELHDRISGGKKDIAAKLKEFAEKFADVWGPGIDIKQGALATIAATSHHYRGIAADPPDAAFQRAGSVGPRPALDPLSNEPVPVTGFALAEAAGVEGAIAEALLHSLERYQGADQVGDGGWALVHARHGAAYARLLAAQLSATHDALGDGAAAVGAADGALDAAAQSTEEFRNQVADTGLGPDGERFLRNLGLDDGRVAEITWAIVSDDRSWPGEASVSSLLAQMQDATTTVSTDLRGLADDLEAIVAGLEADPDVRDDGVVVDAGGPYAATQGDTLTLAGAASADSDGILHYRWDLDGDAAFDDAVGATPTITAGPETGPIIGLEVEDDRGRSNVAYAMVVITPVSTRPELTSASPPDTDVRATVGTPITFTVAAAGPAGDPLSYEWRLDGAVVSDADSYPYVPDAGDIGVHGIEVRVSDGRPSGGTVRHRWLVDVLAADADADGWHANLDCDDGDAARSPGNAELAGNGIDDDCDPRTSDEGIAGTQVLPPILALIQQTQTFYAYAAANESLDITFTKHSSQSDGGQLTVTVSHQGVPDRTCTHAASAPLGATCSWADLTAPTDGIWAVEFRADDEDAGKNTHNYTWDIAVHDAGGEIPGRVWSEAYRLVQWKRQLMDFSIWHATEDGYRYQANYRKFDGINSRFESDAVGVRFHGTCVSAYQSQGAEIQGVSQARGQCGDQHKLFFARPAGDLPHAATLPDGSATWVTPPAAEPVILHQRFRSAGGPTLAGTIEFEVPGFTGAADVAIDADGDGDFDGPLDVVLPVFVAAGAGRVDFDGLDAEGEPIRPGRILDALIEIRRAGEVHFQNGDVEGRVGGLEVVALNGAAPGPAALFWDDTMLSTSGRCSITPVRDGTAGIDSSGGVHGWRYCLPEAWGNNRTIDDWTFNAVSAMAAVQLAAPSADAGGPYEAEEGGGVRLDASASHGGASRILAYEWDLDGDGQYDDAAGSNIPLPLVDDLASTVGLRVTNGDGESATDTALVTTGNVPPTVHAGPDQLVGAAVTLAPAWFTDPGTADTHSATIDWGDGTLESGTVGHGDASGTVSGSHSYDTDGSYAVRVCVTDDDGGTGCDELVVTATVDNQPPEVRLDTPHELGRGEQPHAHAVGITDPNPDDTHSGTVDWGDGSAVEALTITQGHGAGIAFPAHTWSRSGSFLVTVVVCDDRGMCGEATVTENVIGNTPPIAEAGGHYEVDEGGLLRLDGSDSTDEDGDELTFTWELDGVTYDGPVVEIVRDDDFAGEAELTVDDGNGGTASDRASVLVRNVAPTVDAGADRETPWGVPLTLGGTVSDPSPADTAAGFTTSWQLGDGSEPTPGVGIQHTYRDPGTYVATLTAGDKDGGVGSDDVTVTVTRRGTQLAYTGDSGAAFGFSRLSARLSDAVDPATGDVAGLQVTFAVAGRTFVATTDSDGRATVTEPVLLAPGDHAVVVTFTGSRLYAAAATDAMLVVSNSPGKVTAGALRTASDGSAGFIVRAGGATVDGELQFNDATTTFHARELTALGIAEDRHSGWFAGVGRDGRPFVAYVEDRGEPGRNDAFRLWIDGEAMTGDGELRGGNITIHRG